MEHACARAATEVRNGTCLCKDGYGGKKWNIDCASLDGYRGKRWNMLVQGQIQR